jgi:hypothetical protein
MFATVVCPFCTALITVVNDGSRPSRCRACSAPVIGRDYAGRPALRLVRPTASESTPATRQSAPPTYQAAS